MVSCFFLVLLFLSLFISSSHLTKPCRHPSELYHENVFHDSNPFLNLTWYVREDEKHHRLEFHALQDGACEWVVFNGEKSPREEANPYYFVLEKLTETIEDEVEKKKFKEICFRYTLTDKCTGEKFETLRMVCQREEIIQSIALSPQYVDNLTLFWNQSKDFISRTCSQVKDFFSGIFSNFWS